MGKLELMILAFISIPGLQTNHGIQIEGEQFRQLQNQLFYIEENLNNEAKIRRESVQAILNTLYEIKGTVVKLNGTAHSDSQNNGEGIRNTKSADAKVDSHKLALLKAFETEKKKNRRLQRHVETLIETRIGKIESNLENQMQTNDQRMQRHLGEIETTLLDIKQSNKDLVITVKDLNQGLIDVKNYSEVCASELVNRLDDCSDGVSNTIETITSKCLVGERQGDKFESCVQLQNNGFTKSGLYDIFTNSSATPLPVFCDQDTDGGGWIVFQRRKDGSENFYRNWHDYEVGFGNLEGEFWMGNENLHLLTVACCHELRIDMGNFENERAYAKYSNFSIGSKLSNYVLTVEGYSGNAGDSLAYHNSSPFSTYDKDNDASSHGYNCAVEFKGAWWYNFCHYSNLNGQYVRGKQSSDESVNWWHWKDNHIPLKMTEMKLRQK